MIYRWIAGRLSPRTRLFVALAFVLALLVRVSALAAAFLVFADDAGAGLWLGVATAALAFVRQAISTTLRVEAECDLRVGVTEAFLRGDVLEEPNVEPHLALHDGVHTATDLVASGAPDLAAEALASLVAIAVLVRTLAPRELLLLALAVLVVAGGTLLVRGRIRSLHARALATQQALDDAFAIAWNGRLEVVAAAAEAVAIGRVRRAATHFAREARRAAMGVAFVGRLPVALGLLLVAAAVFGAGPLDRAALVTRGPLLLVLAATTPVLLGVAFGVQEALRVGMRLAPFASIVLRPARPEAGGTRPDAMIPLRLDDVAFAYGEGKPVVANVSASWEDGVVVLRGPNGSGKSTLLRLVLGLRAPTRGAVRIGGDALEAVDLAHVRGRVAFLPQRPYLGEPYTTAGDALRLLDPGLDDEALGRALDRVGLRDALSRDGQAALLRPVGELSVGQRQGLALARALAREAPLVLLDEPDANLDAAALDRIAEVIRELGEHALVVVAAHGPLVDRLTGTTLELSGNET